METIYIAALTFASGGILGFFVARFIWVIKLDSAIVNARVAAQTEAQLALEPRLTAAENARFTAEHEAAKADSQRAAAVAEMGVLREQITQFQEMEKERAASSAEEREIIATLGPIRETLEILQSRVNSLDKAQNEKLGQLFTQLNKAQQAEQQLLNTAQQLANTLNNTNKRGSWGEMTLRRLLEQSHLQPNIDYFEQTQTDTSEHNSRPDFIIKVPGGGAIVIDSKAPLLDQIENSNTSEATQFIALAKKISGHITKLAGRNYSTTVTGSPNFVIAFLPSEAILSQALLGNPELLNEAFKKRIVLATPVTLWSVLESVAGLWRQAKITEEAQAVINLGQKLTSGLTTNAKHIAKLGRTIASVNKDYNTFLGSFERSVISQARKLAEIDPGLFTLGNELKTVEETPRNSSNSKIFRELEISENTAEITSQENNRD